MATGLTGQASGMDAPKPETRPTPKLTRLEEARRIIDEYAADLRAINHQAPPTNELIGPCVSFGTLQAKEYCY